jgi:acetyl esterase/lipase
MDAGARARREAIRYGDHPEQRMDLWAPEPPGGGIRGTVALIHGGYWRGEFTRELMAPMAADLSGRGWTVANIEYRRVDAGGGWPLPEDDAIAALTELSGRVRAGELPAPLLAIGHSVGAQLALLAADGEPGDESVPDGILALCPVTDVVTTLSDGLGEHAADALLAGHADPLGAAREASPLHRTRIGCPVIVIHGRDDARVPFAHSAAFVETARAYADVTLLPVDHLDHREAIDPTAAHWPVAVAAIETLADGDAG